MSTHDEKERIEFLQGTLDMLVLRTLLLGPAHGHAIAHAIERNSDDVLQVEQGSLYPALHRLIERGWIEAEEGVSENNRRAVFSVMDRLLLTPLPIKAPGEIVEIQFRDTRPDADYHFQPASYPSS
jgi:transcriptional regulator